LKSLFDGRLSKKRGNRGGLLVDLRTVALWADLSPEKRCRGKRDKFKKFLL